MSHTLTPSSNQETLASFEDILDELELLARDHLLFYRVQVGHTLLRHFWNNDPAAYSSRSSHKSLRFEDFFTSQKEALDRYGLSKYQARDSIRVSIVVRTLPPEVAKYLFIGQVLQLARLADPTQRANVASVAIADDWSVQQLRDAVSVVLAGLPLDGDATTPGVQVPELDDKPRQPAPGRLVTRAERLVQDMDLWTTQWSTIDGSKLRVPQRRRLLAAVTALEAKIVVLRAGLGDVSGGVSGDGAEDDSSAA